MTRKDALKQRYEGAALDGMSLAELRQLRSNITGWLDEWPTHWGADDMRAKLKDVEVEISWRVHSLQTAGM